MLAGDDLGLHARTIYSKKLPQQGSFFHVVTEAKDTELPGNILYA